MSGTAPEMRIGDRARGEVDELLRDALADGVLSLSEYDERAAQCWAARTRSELDAVVADLPGAQPHAAAAPSSPHRVLAVLSESGLEAPLLPGQVIQATAVMGTAEVDLRREDLPSEITVRATAVMGEVKVRVPKGSTVHLTGNSVLGERKAKVGPPVRGGSLVHVEANAVMGTVSVDDKPRKGGLVPAAREGGVTYRQPGALSGSVAQWEQPAPSRGPRPLARAVGVAVPVALAAAGLFAGAQVVTAADGAAVFGSRIVQVSPSQDEVGVGMLFGSVEVVVPDDAVVRTSGVVVFGSVDCEACSGTGQEVMVRADGAFGSVEVVRQSDFDADLRPGP